MENRVTINETRLHEVVNYIKTEDFNYRPMIVREVHKTMVDQGQVNATEQVLTGTVTTHNLTELREQLEEKMLLKKNEKNRTFTA